MNEVISALEDCASDFSLTANVEFVGSLDFEELVREFNRRQFVARAALTVLLSEYEKLAKAREALLSILGDPSDPMPDILWRTAVDTDLVTIRIPLGQYKAARTTLQEIGA